MRKPARPPNPYHVVPGTASRKRILLVSYHAPPSNAVGAIRWTAMARHFAEQGWGFDILAVDPVALPSRNEALLGTLPPGTRLYPISAEPPLLDRGVDALVHARQRLRRRLDSAPRVAPAPDVAPLRPGMDGLSRRLLNGFHAWREYAGGGHWARRAARAGLAIFDPAMHQWVISSGPPHMCHEGGRLLARWTGLPFVADFRDAWSFQEWVPLGDAWRRRARRYERRVVAHSTITVANVEPVRALMQSAYPEARVVTVTNGMDEEDLPVPAPSQRFIIGYPGTIYLGRNPSPLVRAVGGLVREYSATPADLSLEFMGHIEEPVADTLQRLAVEEGIETFVKFHPPCPRPEALRFMATCAVLVGLQAGSDLAVPAKVFEFMGFPAWQLILAGKHGATAALLAGTGADVHEPEDVPGIRASLATRFLAFRAGGRPEPLGREERFTRKFQAQVLLGVMEDLHPSEHGPTTAGGPRDPGPGA